MEYLDPRRQADLRRERLEAVSAEVLAARRLAAAQALARVIEQRQVPHQLPLPGINPTLMALRSREPLTPEERQAAGLYGAGWQRLPEPVGEQLVLDFHGGTAGANNIAAFVRQAEAAAPPSGLSGRRMAMRYGLPALAGLLGISGLVGAALNPGESE